MVLGLAGTALAVPEEGERGVWIVTLHEEHDASTNARLVARSHGGDARFVYDDVLNGFSFHGSERGAANLERDPRVRTVVADQPVSIVAQTTPTGVSRIDARRDGADNDAHDAGHLGEEALVAILDTGIDLDHPDLQSNIVYGDDPKPSSGIGANCIDDSKHPDDGHGHGTHVAGTVAAVDNSDGVVGVAPSAGVVPVKVLDDNGSGSWESVICGVDHVTGLVASGTATIAAANMSLGGSGDASNCFDGGLRQAICESVQVDVVYTVAAGNDNDHSSNHVPAAYPEVMTISALADFDGLEGGDGGCRTYVGGGPPTEQCDDDLAFFSNYGLLVDVTAPGMDIYSTDTGGSYSSKSGTSMAAPHVAGVVALARSVDTTLTYDEVADLLKTTGECLYDNGRTWASADGTCTGDGWGPYDEDTETEPLVNALRASENAGSTSNATPTADFTHSCTDLSCDFDGSGSSDDSEGGIDGYSWRFDDSNAEQVGSASGQTTSFDFPASGDYLATLWVTDDDGALAETTATVSVSGSSGDGGGDDGSTTTGAHVESIGYDTWGGSDGSKHLGVTILIEDSNDQPVSGASVSIVLKLDSDNDGAYDDGSWSGTGTTDSDGTVRFELKNAPSGCYTTDVTDIDGSGDVSEPQNETCK